MVALKTWPALVVEGSRVSVIDNRLRIAGKSEPRSTVRMTLVRESGVDGPGFADEFERRR